MVKIGFAFLSATIFHAVAQPEWKQDLQRAKSKVPRGSFQGEDARAAAEVLNAQLRKIPSLSLDACENLGAPRVRHALELMFAQAEPDLLDVYESSSDPRRRIVSSVEALREQWAATDAFGEIDFAALTPVIRDGLCHEAVMWFVHHVSADGRRALAERSDFVLPMLPLHLHAQNKPAVSADHVSDAHARVYADYEQKVSCQQCHVGPINPALFDPDASLDPPLPVDEEQPGLERKRVCDFQYSPKCGPCEGLGGRRWGDGVHEFEPLPCEVVEQPENVPVSERLPPVYPKMATGSFFGETRSPLAVRLNASEPGKYPSNHAKISLGWDGTVGRMRYDFQDINGTDGGSQIYLQTYDQIRNGNETGAMVTITGDNKCVCIGAIAGIVHTGAFAPHEEFDPLDLPAEEGGSAYLGRVRVPAMDGTANGTVVADHYMEWAFHWLVDAGDGPTRGQPVRLYGPYGVRQVFSDWQLGDPSVARPDVWTIPKGCLITSKACRPFMQDSEVVV